MAAFLYAERFYGYVIACTLFIWHNSLMPATESSAQSMSVLHHLDAVLKWLGVPGSIGHSVLRKMAHMTEFALLNTPPETVPLDRTNGAARPLKWCMVTAVMVH